MRKNIYVVEAPSNLGLKAINGPEPGVRYLPEWLWKQGLRNLLPPVAEVISVPVPAYTGELDGTTIIRNTPALAKYTLALAQVINRISDQHNSFTLVLGGDCSVLLGCMLGLKQTGPSGLFFLDGHTDFITPKQSTTGGAAGMDLALVTGHGPDALTNLLEAKPYMEEQHVWCVGNRYMAPDYVNLIQASAIRYIDLIDLRRMGLRACAQAFLRDMSRQDLDECWIHVDVDVLNDDLMPAVDSRQPGGLFYSELVELLTELFQSGNVRGMDITILDPTLDEDGRYTQDFIQSMAVVWQQLSAKV